MAIAMMTRNEEEGEDLMAPRVEEKTVIYRV